LVELFEVFLLIEDLLIKHLIVGLFLFNFFGKVTVLLYTAAEVGPEIFNGIGVPFDGTFEVFLLHFKFLVLSL
jgi:hypothetical protein